MEEITPLSEVPVPGLIREIVEVLLKKQGEEIVVIDLREFPDRTTDFMILVTADTDIHMKALYEEVYHHLKKTCGRLPHHVEGTEYWRWVVMDYLDMVLHLFLADVRLHYDLESLWEDFPHWLISDLPDCQLDGQSSANQDNRSDDSNVSDSSSQPLHHDEEKE